LANAGSKYPQALFDPPGTNATSGSSGSCSMTTHSHCTWTDKGGNGSYCDIGSGEVRTAKLLHKFSDDANFKSLQWWLGLQERLGALGGYGSGLSRVKAYCGTSHHHLN
jgi:hypothetical protein